jgi:hypothetical protein
VIFYIRKKVDVEKHPFFYAITDFLSFPGDRRIKVAIPFLLTSIGHIEATF